jgi:hypothetical protein
MLPLFLLSALAATAVGATDFQKDVLPVFEKYCLGCHAAGIRMGSFECDTYEGVMRGATHGAVVNPGNAKESRLYLTLTGEIAPAMPMSMERLSEAEIATVRNWINEGAKPPKRERRANLEYMAIPNVKRYRITGPAGETATLMAVLPKNADVDAYLKDASARFDWKAWRELKASQSKVRVGQQKQKKAK